MVPRNGRVPVKVASTFQSLAFWGKRVISLLQCKTLDERRLAAAEHTLGRALIRASAGVTSFGAAP